MPSGGQRCLRLVRGPAARSTRRFSRFRCGPCPPPLSSAAETSVRPTPPSDSRRSGASPSACATASPRASTTARTWATRCGWSWTAHGDLPQTSTARRRVPLGPPSGRWRWRGWRPRSTGSRSYSHDEPSHGDVSWSSSYEIDPFSVPDRDKIALLQDWSERLLTAPGVDHVDASVLGGEGEQVLRRPGGHRHHPAARATAAVRVGRWRGRHVWLVRDDVVGGSPSRPRLGVRGRDELGLGHRARPTARLAGREDEGTQRRAGPLRPRDRSDEPVAHHPRVHRACHRARPGPGIRGQLRRHVVRYP